MVFCYLPEKPEGDPKHSWVMQQDNNQEKSISEWVNKSKLGFWSVVKFNFNRIKML